MKTRGSEEITLREGLASKSTVCGGFARFEKDLRGGRGEERRAASLRVWVGWGCVGWGWEGREGGASPSGTQTVQRPRARRWQDVRRLREGRCTVGCGARLSGATPKGQQSEIFS